MANELAKFLARLSALKSNLPDNLHIPEKYVVEYHSIMDGLESATQEDLADFRIAIDQVTPRVTSWNMVTGAKNFSQERYCDRSFFMTKIDGVLGYFTFILQPQKIKNNLGFDVNRSN